MLDTSMTLNRRTFVKATGALGALAAAGGVASSALFSGGAEPAFADGEEHIVWSHCHVNCGGACVLQCHVKDGELAYVESDNAGDASFGGVQARACLRGRSIRPWLGSADRLNYPMKRAQGTKRGDGQYERISWDEALDTIASEFTRIKEQYGNEAIFIQECSGVEQNIMMNNPFFRLFNLLGGEVTRYGSYSSASISFGAYPYVYGKSWGNRSFKTLQDDQLVVMFGFAPNDMRMAGDGPGYDLNVAREKKRVRIINIDPRRTETCTNLGAEWIPIVPGTDAALVAGLAHELIESNLVDLEFLHTYVTGFDEDTMPEDAKGANASYYDYVMGTGYDKVEKTPAWASSITRIPEERIKRLAHEIGEAKPCFICQGLGMQRHANGDNASRAVMALALMVGQVGKPGTTSGGTIGNGGIGLDSLPTGTNPVKTKIPQYLWPEAIRDGAKLTREHDGVQNADALKVGIKMLVNYGNNMMANQNGDINFTTDILRDESLCEFIVQYDVAWTDSCNWADIVLPDLTPQETYSLTAAGETNDVAGIRFGQPLYEPKFERREVYEVCGELARRLGVYDEYSAGGMTREDWCRKLYDELCEDAGDDYDLPTYDEGVAMGAFTYDIEPSAKVDPFIEDPAANPLKTATGKAQIFSPEIAEMAKTWKLDESEKNAITPIPTYVPGPDSAEDVTDEYPFQILDYHCKGTTHSTYAHNPVLNKITPFQAWINPIDAERMGIADLDRVRLTSAQGSMITQARVTNRVIPGVIVHPQGAWHRAPAEGDRTDEGSCTNTLTSRQRNPISKGTGQHSVIGMIEKVEG
ncbi:DMSO/selenate family reductase complex A subunit [Gordonibacter massiliensis (ex Traore et al. 2017)]|uniref:DMSO/selenate family reductase complex A subunit n=1 Tax=Gordonibacter massiliensis (ex Traore et al. 2017) TaxID=1841863 RepID=UPI001C8C9528|nr:DMSO/selenate family reductase complex A subunit [Gordonibacter massiliensis (ex Traore et al. 2017)]MBX9032701.1 molybdopterin-dependent oxidoreductase [Gordonibacter massiliensis (ex Traore et al. 2017)]